MHPARCEPHRVASMRCRRAMHAPREKRTPRFTVESRSATAPAHSFFAARISRSGHASLPIVGWSAATGKRRGAVLGNRQSLRGESR
jgi:hypothetical protein